jgi:hypothetical protein
MEYDSEADGVLRKSFQLALLHKIGEPLGEWRKSPRGNKQGFKLGGVCQGWIPGSWAFEVLNCYLRNVEL